MKPKLHVHLGPHKTGTTYLQKKVFPALRQYSYAGRRYDRPDKGDDIYQNLMAWCCESNATAREHLIQGIKQSRKPTTVCEEWLSSDYSGPHNRAGPWQGKLKRLAALKSDVDLSVSYAFREPAEALYALYGEFFKASLIPSTDGLDAFIEGNDAQFYRFHETKRLLGALIGEGKVYSIPYSRDLKKAFSSFSSLDLAGWPAVNTSVNASRASDRGLIVTREPLWFAGLRRQLLSQTPVLAKSRLVKRTYNTLRRGLVREAELVEPSQRQKIRINERFGWQDTHSSE